MNKTKTMLAGALLAITEYVGAQTQDTEKDSVQFNTEFNTLETAVTNQDDLVRTRMINAPSVDYKGVHVGFHGLNEINNANPDTYFGRNRLLVGKTEGKNYFIVDAITTKDGLVDTKVGVRNTSIAETIGVYGFLDAETNLDGMSILGFYGRSIGECFSVEGLYVINKEYDGEFNQFLEVQGNYKIGNHLSAFGRMETYNFESPVLMFGLSVK